MSQRMNESGEVVFGPFVARRAGTTGCEIINPDGDTVAWAVDEATAQAIVSLLSVAHYGGFLSDFTSLDSAEHVVADTGQGPPQ